MPPVVRAHETVAPERSGLGTNPGASAPRPEGPPPGQAVVAGPAAPEAAAEPTSPERLAARRDRQTGRSGGAAPGRGTPLQGTPEQGSPEPVAAGAFPPGPRPPGPPLPGTGGRAPGRRHRRRFAVPVAIAAIVLVVLGGLAAVKMFGGGSGKDIPAGYGGTWTGPVYQSDGTTSRWFDVTVTLEADTTSGRLELPGAGCSGRLTLADDSPSELRLNLTIVSGGCPEGDVTVYLDGGSLVYKLYGPGSVTANGKLRRSG